MWTALNDMRKTKNVFLARYSPYSIFQLHMVVQKKQWLELCFPNYIVEINVIPGWIMIRYLDWILFLSILSVVWFRQQKHFD